ncbi:DUF1217 domain-containing protein [Ruegeria sediminis]|uniref:DUF1217 domain-containing protein n=1 Tax=Ruegeria sediminis TaxID=2583820 RepID=A0ABY2WTQ8_9RHOB|nr:DUF1217 domain-containing protein [Ruegeria sediminis]TMV04914.1 DUF1217 domain-containing protein [Ruegeria sediminis]
MSFQPVIPTGGLVGWRFLQRTHEIQLQTFSRTARHERDSRYFLDNIGKVKSAGDLVSDPRLLRVALGAFGLESDIRNTYFIRRILEDGTRAKDALSTRLSDKRYRDLASAFGFGPGELVRTGSPEQMQEIARKNLASRFEASVGETDQTMRIALYAQHALAGLARKEGSENTKWFELMSQPPLRSMMETALGLPKAFAQLDIDRQLEMFKDKLARLTGSPNLSQFSRPEALERLTTTYFARAQMAPFSAGNPAAQTALTLLQSIRPGRR